MFDEDRLGIPTGRVKSVNVNAQIHRLLSANSVLDLLDDTLSTDLVDFSGLDNLEPTVAIVLIV